MFIKLEKKMGYNDTPWDLKLFFKFPYRRVVGQLMYGMESS